MDRSAIFIRLVAAATLSAAITGALPAVAQQIGQNGTLAAQPFPVRSEIGQAQPPQATPIYVPPRRGAPKDVAAAATRGTKPRLKLLAPDHPGLTVAAQPTLYIYTQGAGSIQIQVRRTADSGQAPFLSKRIEVRDQPEIRALSLAELGVSLGVGTEYRLTVLSYDRAGNARGSDNALIERIAAPVELSVMTQNQPALAQANAFASAGVWFDALDAISRAIQTDAASRQGRAALLDQIGQTDAANLDRKGAPQG